MILNMLVPTVIAILLCILLGVLFSAFVAKSFGVILREVSLGYGPKLLSIGIFKIRVLPLGGSVVMKSTRDDEPGDGHGAFELMPVWKQFLLPLSGSLGVLALALLITPDVGRDAFGSAFSEMWRGAFSPASVAQDYLARLEVFSQESSFIVLFALISTKFCAFNLLPIPPMNGGYALLAIGRKLGLKERAEIALTYIGFIPVIFLWLGWLAAFLIFTWRHLA